eukprot:952585-Prymnesium_polylepis.1
MNWGEAGTIVVQVQSVSCGAWSPRTDHFDESSWESPLPRASKEGLTWPMAYDAPCGGSGRYARPA